MQLDANKIAADLVVFLAGSWFLWVSGMVWKLRRDLNGAFKIMQRKPKEGEKQ